MSDRLFILLNQKNKQMTKDGRLIYFNNKMEAKKVRDEMPSKQHTWRVSKGPDHRRHNQ
jgi:hypothetical protein